MNDNPMTFAEFASDLEFRGFKWRGASTFFYEDTIDIITVFTNGSVVIITHDGKDVVRNFIMKQVDNGQDCFFWDGVLQDVLSRF